MIVALAGGVGAGKFLRGLIRTVSPAEVVVIVNTGDDISLHGLHISPDLDTIVYSLADAADRSQGWGLAGETWHALEAMERYRMDAWFRLGDRDLATHLFRTERLGEGATLSTVTAQIARAWGLRTRVLPMSEDPVENRVVVTAEGGDADLHFQEFLVRRGSQDPVRSVYYKGIEDAHPLREAVEALQAADGIVFCPSNPVVSIGPILAFADFHAAVRDRTSRAVGVSPIINGAPVRGPADKLMPAAGLDVSAAGVAKAYAGLLDVLVVDTEDAHERDAVESHAMRCKVAPTLMTDLDAATRLARVVVDSLGC